MSSNIFHMVSQYYKTISYLLASYRHRHRQRGNNIIEQQTRRGLRFIVSTKSDGQYKKITPRRENRTSNDKYIELTMFDWLLTWYEVIVDWNERLKRRMLVLCYSDEIWSTLYLPSEPITHCNKLDQQIGTWSSINLLIVFTNRDITTGSKHKLYSQTF